MKTKKKILVMSPVHKGFGGAEFVVMNLASYYTEMNYESKIVLEDNEFLEDFKTSCKLKNIPIIFSKIGDADLKGIKRLLLLVVQTCRTMKILLKEKPDVVQIVLPSLPQGVHLLLACKLFRVPANIRFALVSASDKDLVSSRKAKIYRWIKGDLQIWSGLSQNNAEIIEDIFGLQKNSVRIIHNGYMPRKINEPKTRQQICSELNIPEFKVLITTTARLTQQKGYKWLIEAIPKIVDEFPNVLFLWIGDGELKEELEHLLESKGVRDYVKMLGFRSDVMNLLKASDLFVFPTEFEGGAPFALHEAIYAQCPVVSSDASGIPEIMKHKKHGLIFKQKDSNDLYEKLRMALADMDTMNKYAALAKKEVSEKFSSNNMYKKYNELMLDVLRLKEKNV